MFNKLLIFICLIVALNFLFLNCDGEPNSTSSDSSDSSIDSSSTVSSSSSINVYIIDSLLLENTNTNPSEPINFQELEVYSGSNASGSNVILNSSSYSSGATHESSGGVTALFDGIKNNNNVEQLYHSVALGSSTSNWVSVGFNTPIIVSENEETNIFIKLYNRNIHQGRAVGVKIHLFDTNNNIVLSSGEITNGAASYDFLYNFSTSTVTID